jgi:hypothetical protein
LGKLVAGTPRPSGWIPLDEVRYRLASRIIDGAGEARRLVANEERAAALAALGNVVWQEAWDEAVASVTESVVDRVEQHIDAEARAVGMRNSRRLDLKLDTTERRGLAARLGSAGNNLIPALDRLNECAAGALQATALERDAVDAWQEGLKSAARQLEAAWLALEQAVDAEELRWKQLADEVAAWRKPTWPLILVAVPALAVATWLGLVFGGYVDAPVWLQSLWRLVFRR